MEGVLKRDRMVVIGGLAGVVALAWIFILFGAGMDMTALEMTRLSAPAGWDMRVISKAVVSMPAPNRR